MDRHPPALANAPNASEAPASAMTSGSDLAPTGEAGSGPAPAATPAWGALPFVLKMPHLAYVPSGRRDLRLDFLRGFCALAMIVDHIGGASWLYALTGGNRFFTSAAEGFIFISGLVVGIVYRGFMERDGLGPALRRVLERAAQLYLLAVGLTLVFLPVSELLGLRWAQGVDLSDPAAFVVSVLTLHRTYYVVDIPLLYALLLAVTPLALVLLSQGYTPVVLVLSWGLWGGYQFFPEQADVPWPIAGNYAFHFSAWQVLFITAMVIGYHRDRVAAALRWVPRWPALVVSGLGVAALVAIYRGGDAFWRMLPVEDPASLDVTDLVVTLFGKGDLRPGRLVAFAVVFVFCYLLVDRLWRAWDRALGWLLLPLGQNALYAYAVHVVFVLLVGIFLPPLALTERWLRTVYTALQLALVGLTWLMIRGRLFLPRGRPWRAWIATPAAATVACLLVLPLDPSPTLPGWARGPAPPAGDPRVARAFGTPVPRGGKIPEFPAREPIVRRPGAAAGPARTAASVSPYVGAVRGSFRQQYFYSPALDTEMPYFVYLPPDYDAAGRRYPVVFMLHGISASYEEWLAYGFVDALDRLITAAEVQPMIVVFPQGDYSYWVNHADDGPRWGDYIAYDLVRHMDSTYRTLPWNERRAVGGVSMGGHGALQLAFNYPWVFGVAGAHSPSLREDDGEVPFLGTGEEWEKRDPLSLAATAPNVEGVKIWIDLGDEDVYYDRVEQLKAALEERGIEPDWHVQLGRDHGWWDYYVEDYIRFYDAALNPR
ncbi:MAG TPA: OpgC domain-containing protein [Chloroflexota bacterium]|nr:OpgC domain-containing protein [Chloroflexota bacterium]